MYTDGKYLDGAVELPPVQFYRTSYDVFVAIFIIIIIIIIII